MKRILILGLLALPIAGGAWAAERKPMREAETTVTGSTEAAKETVQEAGQELKKGGRGRR